MSCGDGWSERKVRRCVGESACSTLVPGTSEIAIWDYKHLSSVGEGRGVEAAARFGVAAGNP